MSRRSKKYREADYIKIGGKVYPQEDFSNDDMNTVLAKTKASYEKEMSDREKAAKIKDAEMKLSKISGEITFEKMVKAFASDTGKDSTVGAELLRAMNFIQYRFYNDGDIFYKEYGRDVLMDSVAYILYYIERLEDIFIEAVEKCDELEGRKLESMYKSYLDTISEMLVESLLEDKKYLLGELSEVNFKRKGFANNLVGGKRYFDDYRTKYDYDITFPEEVMKYVDRGDIGWEDVANVLEEMCDHLEIDSRNVTRVYELEFSICDLVDEEYKAVEKEVDSWIEGYVEELKDYYGDPQDWEDEE